MNEISIRTRSSNLCALIWGDRSCIPVIAIHGWLDNAASFIPLSRHLSNIHLVALDLPGHGKSEHRSGASAYHVIDYATDVLLAAEALGFETFSIIGHSLGAIVGATLAAGVPDRVERLVMIDGLGPMTEGAEKFPERLERHFAYAVRQSKGLKTFQSKAAAIKARQYGDAVGKLRRNTAEALAERNLSRAGGGFQWATDPKLLMPTPIYWTERHVLELLPHIQCESRLVLPDEGIVAGWATSNRRQAAIADLEIVYIKGKHHVHMDDPETVSFAIQPFMNRQIYRTR